MMITLKTIGDLRDYFGREPQEIELPENSSVKDLLQFIGEHWGKILPNYIWDSETNNFRSPVFLVVNNKVMENLSNVLHDGIVVTVVHALVGG